jgi:hypothetical protein
MQDYHPFIYFFKRHACDLSILRWKFVHSSKKCCIVNWLALFLASNIFRSTISWFLICGSPPKTEWREITFMTISRGPWFKHTDFASRMPCPQRAYFAIIYSMLKIQAHFQEKVLYQLVLDWLGTPNSSLYMNFFWGETVLSLPLYIWG